MMYIDYELSKRRLDETRKAFEAMLDEKEELFVRTQPGATRYDKVRVTGGKTPNAFEDYVSAKERTNLDERLDEMRSLMQDRQTLLKAKEADLRKSNDILDRVYCLRMIDKQRIFRIAKITHYTDRQIYRFVGCIIRTINEATTNNVGKCQ